MIAAMPCLELIDNATHPARQSLLEGLKDANRVHIASAFVTEPGLNEILEPLTNVLERNGSVTMLYGLDGHITDPEVPELLLRLSRQYPSSLRQFVHLQWANAVSQKFHTKLCLTVGPGESTQVLIGSSNLTLGGLRDNTEANVVLTGHADDIAFDSAFRIFERIENSAGFCVPDEGVIGDYALLKARARNFPVGVAPPRELANLFRRLQRRCLVLAAEASPPNQRRGWTEEVAFCVKAVEAIGIPEFTVHDFYAWFERRLSSLYPMNRNVQPKIRQQLQILVRRGRLQRLTRGRYRITGMSDDGASI